MKKLNALIILTFVLVSILPACQSSSPTKAAAVEKTQLSGTTVTSNYIWPINNKIYSSGEDFVAGDDNAGFISAGFDSSKHHTGIDLAFKDGTPVYAAASGTVVFAGCSDSECGETCDDKCNKRYGKYIIISHPDGMMTAYAHLQEFKISKGASVKQGDLIGLVGHTGFATGAHLHFEIRKDSTPVDPLLYLPEIQ